MRWHAAIILLAACSGTQPPNDGTSNRATSARSADSTSIATPASAAGTTTAPTSVTPPASASAVLPAPATAAPSTTASAKTPAKTQPQPRISETTCGNEAAKDCARQGPNCRLTHPCDGRGARCMAGEDGRDYSCSCRCDLPPIGPDPDGGLPMGAAKPR